MGAQVMGARKISLSHWEREGAHCVSDGKGEGDAPRPVTLTLPALRASLPLPMGEGL